MPHTSHATDANPIQVETARLKLAERRRYKRQQQAQLQAALDALETHEQAAQQQLEAAQITLADVHGENFMWQ